MTAASADRQAYRKPGDYVQYPVIATDIIYNGTLIANNIGHATEGGYAKPMENEQFNVFLGVADEKVDNSAGAAGAKNVKVWKTGSFIFDFNGTPVAADIGKQVYAVDDKTVGLAGAAATSYEIFVGTITEIVSTTQVRVRIDDAVDKFPHVYAYGVAATTDIARGDLVSENAGGYAVSSADTTSYQFLGVAIARADNNPGSAGDILVHVVADGCIVYMGTSAAIGGYTIGDAVYADGAQAVDLAGGTSNADQFVGRITRLNTTNYCWIKLLQTES